MNRKILYYFDTGTPDVIKGIIKKHSDKRMIFELKQIKRYKNIKMKDTYSIESIGMDAMTEILFRKDCEKAGIQLRFNLY